jgi:hypothetical protein
MHAVVMTAIGGPEVLEIRRVALQWPRSGSDVLVRLKAASLNPADIYFRAHGPYIKSEAPCILGHDGAGLVEEVGGDVTRFRPGDDFDAPHVAIVVLADPMTFFHRRRLAELAIANRLSMMQLLAQLNKPDARIEDLERTISQDLSLSYKLLSYINSAMLSLNRKVDSIRHATLLVGLEKMRIWASLIREARSGHCVESSSVRAIGSRGM